MSLKWMLVALASLSIVSGGRAQDQKPPLPKGQMPDLGRPTKTEDELPPFNFDDYFVGKWTFEWDVPDGPLGEAGRITGTTTYRALGGRNYEATTEAEGPGGKFTVKEVIDYQKDQKVMSRHVTDTRGFAFDETATIGSGPCPRSIVNSRVRNPSTKPFAASSISTTRLNPCSLSGEKATTSCFTGA